MTEPAEDSRTGRVPSPRPVPGVLPPAAAVRALHLLLEAKPGSIAQMLRHTDLLAQLHDDRAAVRDGHCDRVLTYTAFARHLRAGGHTPTNCRWAEPADLPYPRFPHITDCWTGGTT